MAYTIEKGKKLIPADNGCFQYVGRIDFDDPRRPVMAWPREAVRDAEFHRNLRGGGAEEHQPPAGHALCSYRRRRDEEE